MFKKIKVKTLVLMTIFSIVSITIFVVVFNNLKQRYVEYFNNNEILICYISKGPDLIIDKNKGWTYKNSHFLNIEKGISCSIDNISK